MPDYGERPAEENERRLETASCRDPPPNNHGIRVLERALLPEQHQHQQYQQHQQSGGRKMTGGIMRLANYRGYSVNIRAPKWKDFQLWITCEDYEAAQYVADAAYYFTGRPPKHFLDARFNYLPLYLSTGEVLTTREKCSAHVAKIAQHTGLSAQRKDFKDRAQKLILEMLKLPEVVEFLCSVRGTPRQVCPLPPEASLEEDTGDENRSAMDVETSSGEAFQAVASTVPAAIPEEESYDDGGDENGTPMEVDSLSEEAIQTLAPPTGTLDPSSVFHSSFPVDFDIWTSFIPNFDMELDDPENTLTSACLSLGVWPRSVVEKENEDLVPENLKGLMASLDSEEEKTWNLIRTSRLGATETSPTICPAPAPAASGTQGQNRGTTFGVDANEALRLPVPPILCWNNWRPSTSQVPI